MFKQIWKALRGSDRLSELIAQLGQMLDAGQWMFGKAAEVLTRSLDSSKVADDLYARDRDINRMEQTIREGILTHLAVGNKADLSACLVLMSVVKDAERIGDYCKNLLEVGKFYQRDFTHPEYAGPLEDIRRQVEPLFGKAKECFTRVDAELAREVLAAAGALTKECDVLVRQLLSVREKVAPDEAVAYVLQARFFKRVSAHLGNIATSVLAPVSMIDYREVKAD